MNIVTILLMVVAVYLAAGLVFAIPFVIKGVTKIDEGAYGSTWGFRMIIIPGTIVFWPLLLKRWLKASNK
jgi:hypothetical protein